MTDADLKPGDPVEVWGTASMRWTQGGIVAETSATVVRIGEKWYPRVCVRRDRAAAVRRATEDYLGRDKP